MVLFTHCRLFYVNDRIIILDYFFKHVEGDKNQGRRKRSGEMYYTMYHFQVLLIVCRLSKRIWNRNVCIGLTTCQSKLYHILCNRRWGKPCWITCFITTYKKKKSHKWKLLLCNGLLHLGNERKTFASWWEFLLTKSCCQSKIAFSYINCEASFTTREIEAFLLALKSLLFCKERWSSVCLLSRSLVQTSKILRGFYLISWLSLPAFAVTGEVSFAMTSLCLNTGIKKDR